MKLKKLTFLILTTILSTGLLFGCGNANDQQEPDPTEEPSEQQNQEKDEQEPDPTEEPSEQQNQGNNELEEEQG